MRYARNRTIITWYKSTKSTKKHNKASHFEHKIFHKPSKDQTLKQWVSHTINKHLFSFHIRRLQRLQSITSASKSRAWCKKKTAKIAVNGEHNNLPPLPSPKNPRHPNGTAQKQPLTRLRHLNHRRLHRLSGHSKSQTETTTTKWPDSEQHTIWGLAKTPEASERTSKRSTLLLRPHINQDPIRKTHDWWDNTNGKKRTSCYDPRPEAGNAVISRTQGQGRVEAYQSNW